MSGMNVCVHKNAKREREKKNKRYKNGEQLGEQNKSDPMVMIIT